MWNGEDKRAIAEVLNSSAYKNYFNPPPVVDGCTTEPMIRIGGREVLQLCTANYLGMATDPSIKHTVCDAIEQYGMAASGSRWVCGTQYPHVELEKTVASLQGEEDAVVFFLVTVASAGCISAMMKPPHELFSYVAKTDRNAGRAKTEIFIDYLSHPSLFDAVKLCAPDAVHIYRHCDMYHLEGLIQKSDGHNSTGVRTRRMIITDGVFSAEGDLAPLPDIVQIAEKYDCLVCVDDAHGTGVFGDNGRGTWEHFGVQSRIDLKIGSLAKAYGGGLGAFVTGDKMFTDFIRATAHHYVFGGSIPPALAAGISAIIKQTSEESWRRERTLENAEYLRKALNALGFDTLTSESMIIPILIGDEERGLAVSKRLFQGGVLAPCFRYPAVPPKKARIRLQHYGDTYT